MTASVVIVTYNSAGTLPGCLSSLRRFLPGGFELIVVDNASSDGSVGIAGSEPDVKLICNRANAGFACAVNQGLRIANADVILLVNPDLEITEGSLEVLMSYLEREPRVGIVGPKIVLENGRIDHAGKRSMKRPDTYWYKALFLDRLFPKSRRFGRYYLTYLDPNEVLDVDAVVGAFMIIRAATLAEIGLMDERFFMYCEDEDLCFRAKQSGWKVRYHPGLVVKHSKSSSARREPVRTSIRWHRSVLLFHRKNLAADHPIFMNWGVYGLIALSLGARMASALLARPISRRSQASAPHATAK